MKKKSKELKKLIEICKKLKIFFKNPRVKSASAEKKVERIIMNNLKKFFPDYGILSEISGFKNKSNKNEIWIIDSIDGTENFLRGIPFFSISIALEVNGTLKCGIIFNPSKNEIYFAEKNKGAFINDKEIKASNMKSMKKAIFANHGPFKNNKNKNAILKDYTNISMLCDNPIRKFGSPALDLAFVASGKIDGYWVRKINYWDIAAGLIIAMEAGAKIKLRKLKYINEYKFDLLASNKKLFKKFKKELKF